MFLTARGAAAANFQVKMVIIREDMVRPYWKRLFLKSYYEDGCEQITAAHLQSKMPLPGQLKSKDYNSKLKP